MTGTRPTITAQVQLYPIFLNATMIKTRLCVCLQVAGIRSFPRTLRAFVCVHRLGEKD